VNELLHKHKTIGYVIGAVILLVILYQNSRGSKVPQSGMQASYPDYGGSVSSPVVSIPTIPVVEPLTNHDLYGGTPSISVIGGTLTAAPNTNPVISTVNTIKAVVQQNNNYAVPSYTNKHPKGFSIWN
jgi:hypothetical protein